MEHGSGNSSAILRALDVLETLARRGSPMTLTDLAAETATPKGSLHRLLQSLQSRGYVTQDVRTGQYAAGIRCFELGSLWAQNLDLRSVAAPYLQHLNAVTRETVHLGVYENGDVVYIERLESPQQVIAKSYVGRRCTATCVATGRVLLAFSDAAEIERVLEQPVSAYTEHSITDPAELTQMFTEIRARGFGINRCSYREEVSGIAAPVRDHTGRVVAAVGLCLPDHRFGPDRIDMLREVTVETAMDISHALGAPSAFLSGAPRPGRDAELQAAAAGTVDTRALTATTEEIR